MIKALTLLRAFFSFLKDSQLLLPVDISLKRPLVFYIISLARI
jgi:hypothetical protein